jgi:hypothetical protein
MVLSLAGGMVAATPSYADDTAASADVLVDKALQDCYVTRQNRCNDAIDLHERKWTEQFIQRSYEWHLFSTRLIFFLVIAIVIFGLYITYLQFNRDYHQWSPAHRPSTAPPAPAPAAAGAGPGAAAAAGAADNTLSDAQAAPLRPVSSIKVGAGGLELSSQVIGLIVLALSFGFFYLYVKEVYPMVENASHAGLSTAKDTTK